MVAREEVVAKEQEPAWSLGVQLMPCSKRMLRCYSGCLHRRMVEDYYCAREAQLDRAEAAGSGYASETRDFYHSVESKLTFKAWLRGMRSN